MNYENDTKIINVIKQILNEFGDQYIYEGIIKRSKVVEALDDFNHLLMEKILENNLIRKYFVQNINGIDVFEMNKFVDFMDTRDFWNNNYTKYSNIIGLNSMGKFINDSDDVILDFPFKDNFLKANMSSDDQNNNVNEKFLNEIIAKPEIDEMLEPKIFTNVTFFNRDGKHNQNKFSMDDNLIVKGNNLIALYSLAKRYTSKIKLIYLDPPYNTGNDSFLYNDNFNHSAWLTFMKNRLEIARDLLTDDGTIWVQTDDSEVNYLGVLMDEIFKRKNFNNIVTIKNKVAGVSGSSEGKSLKDETEFIQVYSKNKELINFNSIYDEYPINDYIKSYKKTGKSWKYTQIIEKLGEKKLIFKDDDKSYFEYPDTKLTSIKKFAAKNNISEDEVYEKYGSRIFRTTNAQSSKRKSVENDLSDYNNLVSIEYIPIKGKNKNNITEVFYYGKNKNMLMFLSDRLKKDDNNKLVYQKKVSNLWNNIEYNNIAKEGKISFSNGKKPEKILENIISIASNPGDIVMDFFMGSATTPAVSIKEKRRFIGIEQMNYINTISIPRLRNVIDGEQGGISKEINWNGGGSFTYFELMEKNQQFIDKINKADSDLELNKVIDTMKKVADIDFKIDFNNVIDEIKNIDLNNKKKKLISVLDKNQLYYNYANINDGNIRSLLSESDYEFNKSFYGDKKNE